MQCIWTDDARACAAFHAKCVWSETRCEMYTQFTGSLMRYVKRNWLRMVLVNSDAPLWPEYNDGKMFTHYAHEKERERAKASEKNASEYVYCTQNLLCSTAVWSCIEPCVLYNVYTIFVRRGRCKAITTARVSCNCVCVCVCNRKRKHKIKINKILATK